MKESSPLEIGFTIELLRAGTVDKPGLFLPTEEIGNMLGDEGIRTSAGLMYALLWL